MATASKPVRISVPTGFDLTRPTHVAALRDRLAERGYGDEWQVREYLREEGVVIVARPEDGRKTLPLGRTYKPTEGERAAKQLEERYPGYALTEFNPHLDRVILSRLTSGELRAREAVAAVLGARPWDVQVASTEDGGYELVLPGGRYVPSRHDALLTEVAERVVGEVGWYARIDARTKVMRIIPADPPTFPARIGYPFGFDEGDPADLDWVMKIPVGEALGGNGKPNQPLFMDLDGSAGALLTGTPGGGKAQPLTSKIVVPVDERFPDGLAKIGDLRVGDMVVTPTGAHAAITRLSPVTRQRVLRLTFETGQTVDATADHLWRVARQTSARREREPGDWALARKLRRYAAAATREAMITQSEMARMFALDQVAADGVLDEMLSTIAYGDAPRQFPLDEALVACSAWLEHGRAVPWAVMTTVAMLNDTAARLVPAHAPAAPSTGAISERATAIARRLVDGEPVASLGRDAFERHELARALEREARREDLIGPDGRWSIPAAASEAAASILRASGRLVTVGAEFLTVSTARHIRITRIDDVGIEPARCLVVDDPEHLYLAEGWIPTHNSVSVNAIIYGLLVRGWEVAIADKADKAVDYLWVRRHVRDYGMGCQGMESTAALARYVLEEGTSRAELLRTHGVQKWQELPAAVRPAPLAIFFDETQRLLAKEPSLRSLAEDHPLRVAAEEHNSLVDILTATINAIPAQMRFVGIRTIIITQQASERTGVGPSLKMLLPNRFLFGAKPTAQERSHALRNPQSAPHVPPHLQADEHASKGVTVVELEGEDPVVAKSYYSPVEEYRRRLEQLGAPTSMHPEVSKSIIDRVLRFDEETASQRPRYEEWEVDQETGEPLSGFARANAARHAATAVARQREDP